MFVLKATQMRSSDIFSGKWPNANTTNISSWNCFFIDQLRIFNFLLLLLLDVVTQNLDRKWGITFFHQSIWAANQRKTQKSFSYHNGHFPKLSVSFFLIQSLNSTYWYTKKAKSILNGFECSMVVNCASNNFKYK